MVPLVKCFVLGNGVGPKAPIKTGKG
jgi:hypothetical protein